MDLASVLSVSRETADVLVVVQLLPEQLLIFQPILGKKQPVLPHPPSHPRHLLSVSENHPLHHRKE